VNDSDNDDAIGELHDFGELDRAERVAIMKVKEINPKSYNQVDATKVKAIFDEIRKAWNWVVCNMKTSGMHDSDPWNFCSSQGGDLTYYFFIYVKLRGGASIKAKICADLPSDIFSCSVKNTVEINVDDDTTMPVKQRSKFKTNNKKVFDMIASSNEDHACSSQENIDVQ